MEKNNEDAQLPTVRYCSHFFAHHGLGVMPVASTPRMSYQLGNES